MIPSLYLSVPMKQQDEQHRQMDLKSGRVFIKNYVSESVCGRLQSTIKDFGLKWTRDNFLSTTLLLL